jgi:hypothetical protein
MLTLAVIFSLVAVAAGALYAARFDGNDWDDHVEPDPVDRYSDLWGHDADREEPEDDPAEAEREGWGR